MISENYDINMIDPFETDINYVYDKVTDNNNNINYNKNNQEFAENQNLCPTCLIKMFHCRQCEGYFYVNAYARHLKNCSNSYQNQNTFGTRFHCKFCKLDFESLSTSDFETHVKICSKFTNEVKSEPEPEYSCIFCNLKFPKSRENEFLEHCGDCNFEPKVDKPIIQIPKIKFENKPLICPRCNEEFNLGNNKQYAFHVKTCSKNNLAVECIYCKNKFEYEKIEDHEDKCIMNGEKVKENTDFMKVFKPKIINKPKNISNNIISVQDYGKKGVSSQELLKEWDLYNTIYRKIPDDIESSCKTVFKDLMFNYDPLLLKEKHFYNSNKTNNKVNATTLKRIHTEFKSFSKGLPSEFNTSFFIRAENENPQYIKFLIAGSRGTPYEHGLFLFDLFLPVDYPNSSPKCNLMTTGNRKIRFNPNLYNCGKICLSLLGKFTIKISFRNMVRKQQRKLGS